MGLVVTVLVSVHQEFPASLEALDLLDQQDYLAIMGLKDPWAQEETGEIKALEEVKVLKVQRDLKDHQDQPGHLETRVTQGLVEAKVPQVPRDRKDPQVKQVPLETKVTQVLAEDKVPKDPRDLKDPQVKQVPLETKVMQVLVEAKVSQAPRELLGHWDVTGNNVSLRT